MPLRSVIRAPYDIRYSLGGMALLALCGGAIAAPPPLPVPCAAAACGNIRGWVTSGAASLAQSGGTMNITQTTPSAVLNWQSFDIAAGNTVNFKQPSSNSVALNQIFEANPSQIFGTLTANGEVYLINPNGIVFGPHSTVNVGGLVASSLAISQKAFDQNGNVDISAAIAAGQPAFEAVDENGNPIQNLGVIDIQQGANITTAQGGQVLILAPTVDNEGTIQAPAGQTILAAGQRVFLSATGAGSSNANLRGLRIEVGGAGTVTNGGSGEVISTAGDVTLAALAVNQMGRVSASTTVDSNGSIVLKAQVTTDTSISPGTNTVDNLTGFQAGTLILGPGSQTDISLQGSDTTAGATAQPPSVVQLEGVEIELLDGASIVAPHGNVILEAIGSDLINAGLTNPNILSDAPGANPGLTDATALTAPGLQPDASRIWLAPSSVIDVSGPTISQPASLNSLSVELNSPELANSPLQRNSPLFEQPVYVDIRQHGTSNGTSWVGTPIADLSSDVAAIAQNVSQRSLTGGTITLNSSGSVIQSPGATLDVSGGQIDWQAGYVKSSVLVGVNGQLYPIAAANPNIQYLGTLNQIDQSDPHWGSTAYFTLPGLNPQGTYQPAYVQGMDAGTINVVTPAFVLDGNIEGSAVRGSLQVNPPTPLSTIPEGELYRYADQVPLGGQLILGYPGALANPTSPQATAEVLQNLTFASSQVLASLAGPSGGAFDPAVDPLPSGFVSSLRPNVLGISNVSQLQAYAEGSITVSGSTVLDPGAGGSLSLVAGLVDVAGNIAASDGSVTLETLPTPLFGAGENTGAFHNSSTPSTSLEIAPGASVDLSGTWVDQNPIFGSSSQAPLFTSGGAIQFLAPYGGSLILSSGASLNVDGGARKTASGALIAGTGGSITIDAPSSAISGNPRGALELDASLGGFALEDGGRLSVTLPVAVCVSSAACTDPTAYRIDPGYLTDFGFSMVTLASKGTPGGLVVAPDVDTTVRQLNLEFSPGSFDQPSAGSLAGLTSVIALPQYMRQPESLSLSSNTLTTEQPGSLSYSDLTIDQGASLTFDPLAGVSLTTNSRIFMNGSITAPAATLITLGITGDILDASDQTVLGDQAIWLGPKSTLDASGTVVLTPNNLGLQLGSVLPGGKISISADRGYLLALPGSSILAAGASAVIDESSPGSGTYHPATVASTGGWIQLSASEGMQLDGMLAAPAGRGAAAAGGTLGLALNGNDARAQNPNFAGSNGALNASRILTVTATNAPTVIAEGAAIPNFLDGQGSIPAATITSGGFDNVSLSARNLVGLQQDTTGGGTISVVESVGAVAFDPGVSLSPRASLVVDAPELRASDGQVSLSSAYVALGSTDTLNQQVDPHATAGKANLSVTAQLIDLVGAMDLDGFGVATLSSSGDIRAVGVQLGDNSSFNPGDDANFAGALTSPGALNLTAQQIYPTTLTSYGIDLTGTSALQSTLTLNTAAGTDNTVLSAAGSLTLAANQILDSGVLRAPMGAISFEGVDLHDPISGAAIPSVVKLAAGALVSVSADGATIPFGETQGGLDWTYTLVPNGSLGTGGQTLVYGTGTGDLAPPQKAVSISAADFQFSPGATIDVSGGGDLVAYEYTPANPGNRDVLSTSYAPNTYAVLPGLKLPYAPIDPHEDIGFEQPVGSSVYLSGGDGLPAGSYALLPARYALLPGAYLVTAVPGYANLSAGQSYQQTNGSVIVSGYRTVAGTGLHDSQTSGWDVMPGSYAYQEAPYTLTSANTFFAAQAKTNSVTTPGLPEDAGSLAIRLTGGAQLAGTLVGTPADGGRGATLDLTATDLYIASNSAGAPTNASYVTIDPAQLDALGAQSILLGATRSTAGDLTNLDVTAQNLVVAQNADLSAPELILAASGALQIESGAQIDATGAIVAAEPAFSAPVGTTLVRASTGPQVPLVYATGTSGAASSSAASLTVAQGATVGASGSMSFDAGGAVDFSGSLSAANAAVRIGGNDIALGAVPAGFSGFVIGSALLANLAGSQLTLDATAPVAIYGPVGLTLKTLDIAAPGLDVSQAGVLNVMAGSITLGNPAGSVTPVAGTGSVSLDAAHIMLANGTFAVTGAAAASIAATSDLTSTGTGALATAGSLALTSPIMQSASGKSYTFSSDGPLTTALAATGAGSTTAASGPGGFFTFNSSGAGVQLGGNIVLPAGRVEATASGGDVTVAAGGVVDVAGFSETFDNVAESAGGGTVILSSTTGNVTIEPNAIVDVSAGKGGGAGGSLVVSAPAGTAVLSGQIQGDGATGQGGGALTVQALSLDFGSLMTLDQTGGFSGAFDVHELGSGNFDIAAGSTLKAADIELTADQGSIEVDGGIDATTDLGGTIMLAAGDNVVVNGALNAGSPTHADRGGTVELYTDNSNGGIFVNGGATIDVGGAGAAGSTSSATGTVWLRAPAQSVLSVLGSGPQLIALQGAITGAAHVYLEGYSQVSADPASNGDGEQIDPGVIGQANTTASSFMSQAMPATGVTVAQVLGQAKNPAFTVMPGIEIDAPGDLTLTTTWDFSAGNTDGYNWRFGPNQDIPGVLTVRAGGNFNVGTATGNASISDGFFGTTESNFDPTGYYNGFTLDPAIQTSWSYRLAAGANLASANPLAVSTDTAAGDLIVAPGGLSETSLGATTPTMIRTGTGSIQIAAAGSLELGNQASVIYTAGAADTGNVDDLTDQALGFPGPQYSLNYPIGGGNVSVDVGDDIVGAASGSPSNQLFTDWLWRSGVSNPTHPQYAVPASWAPAYDYFEQGIGALGGGDLNVRAGGNIVDLSANVPSAGVPIKDASGAVATTEVNDGVLRITAGGDIDGGKFLDMAGQAFVTAGGQITVGSAQPGAGTGLYPVLALGSGQFAVTARGGLSIDAIVDPTLLPVSPEETYGSSVGAYGAPNSGNEQAAFSTYGNGSGVTLTSTGGDVSFLNRTDPLRASSTNLTALFDGVELQVLPPTLQAIALGGNAAVSGDVSLWPSANGNLNLLAAGSVLLDQTLIRLSDADPASLPGLANPTLAGSPGAQSYVSALYPVGFTNLDFNGPGGYTEDSGTPTDAPHAPQPVHGGAYSTDGLPDLVPARVVALAGDVSFQDPHGGGISILDVAKPVDVIAGGNIIDPSLYVQQFSSTNLSSIIAGGKITYPNARDSTGALVQNFGGIVVAGPGRLDVQAGGTINLGTSNGISSIGNLDDSALPSQGADVTVSAGLNQAPQYQSFIDTYLAQSDVYDSELIQYTEQLTGTMDLDKAQALKDLEGMPAEEQQLLLQQILFDELRAGGRAAAAAGPDHGNFTRAFDALTALFPGSNASNAKDDPYSGDLLLYFSRIYTLSGGDINLLAPGGLINVGLAVAPASFGIKKQPSNLGIVAAGSGAINMVSYSDIDVNQSRVFAADGGDILMWSTNGNIDAGRGARSAVSAPPPSITVNAQGQVSEVFPPALTGSGIQALSTTPGLSPGSVDLFAPHGVVNANEAGIVAGNITIYAVQVLGTNNISYSGTAVGVPVAVTGLGASLAAASSSGSAASSVGESSVTQSSGTNQAPQAQAALNWLDVFILGLGEAQCAPGDLECIKREQIHH